MAAHGRSRHRRVRDRHPTVGDLSELALGWCTYGVGDQMPHYNVNASVPKTLLQFLIRWVASTERFGPEVSAILADVVETETSPEAPRCGSPTWTAPTPPTSDDRSVAGEQRRSP